MLDAYIYAGLRTPFGRLAGALAPVRPDDLAAALIRKLVADSPFDPAQVEDVILGCAGQAGEDSRNIARHAVLLSGLPHTVPGQTVNRLCSSGLAAVLDAARAITSGEGELYVAGGVESMSRAPFVVAKSEAAFGREFKVFDSALGARFPNPRITKEFGGDTMPETADNVAQDLGLSREDSDRFAALSQARYAAALADGFFAGEIMPVEVPTGKKTPPRLVADDEQPRPESTLETLAKLKALQEGGVVTAGNASSLNDGAAALLVGSRAAGEKAGIKPMARILAGAAMDLIEINEAFAAQVLGCLKLMDVAFDDPRVNPNGGAIAVGHPLGASGARLALSAARELERRGGRYAVISLCIGVGQGLAVVIERV